MTSTDVTVYRDARWSGHALLSAEGVTVSFGGVCALESVNLYVEPGIITGLIGPNGAGKTTLFNVLCGLIVPSSGKVMFDGTDITFWPTHRRGRAGIARTFQRLELFSGLSVRDNLTAAWEASHRGGVWGVGRRQCRQRVDEVVEMLNLDRLVGRIAGELPTGHGRMVELGRALCTDPRVILLDEPGSGLDARETDLLAGVLRRMVGSYGDSEPVLLLVEHDMALVMELCDTIWVLDFGRMIASGSSAEIRADPKVRAAYLGEPDAA